MEHRIVVGVDGSPSSLLALQWAARLVPTVADSVTAVAAWQVPFTYYEFPVSGWDPKSVARTILSKALDEAFDSEPPPFVSAETRQGPAAGVLMEESRNAEMLIVGSRGHGGFVGLLLGSVSSAVAEHASCAVLIAHEPEKHSPPSGSSIG
ncbi:universal stress protein [Arthrobacter sp. 260]|uniref:universal stress protein n=1 Tax=Arthrobacter sp. 260 TaxID=2735314 RepID=UPI0014910CC5|nr:universal stress protein [Arthrobacter sp. 260]NOJ58865.1 universal stress protein [Arthrobacter sp. 260]